MTSVPLQVYYKLIVDWSSADDQTRRAAEEQIEKLLDLTHGQIDVFVQALCELLCHPQRTAAEHRQRIAILLRTRILTPSPLKTDEPYFCRLHPSTQTKLLEVLLAQIGSDPDVNTRNCITDCVCQLTAHTLGIASLRALYETSNFMQCIVALYQKSAAAASGNDNSGTLSVTNCINALQIFGYLCLNCADADLVIQHKSLILKELEHSFKQHSNVKVRIAALEAIQLAISACASAGDLIKFVPSITAAAHFLSETLNAEASRVAVRQQQSPDYVADDTDFQHSLFILEIVVSICASAPRLFADCAPPYKYKSPLLEFCTVLIQIAATTTAQYPSKVRIMALEFFLTLAENDSSLARKKRVIPQSVLTLCMDYFLQSQIDDAQWDTIPYYEGAQEASNDYNALFSAGEYGVDRLLNAMTAEAVLPDIYKKLGEPQKYWNDAHNWRAVHCAVTVITQVSDHMDSESSQVALATQKCLQLLRTAPSVQIRYACINAIGQLSHDHPQVLCGAKFRDEVLRALREALDAAQHIKLQTHACAAILNFIENLEDGVDKEPLHALLNDLMNVLRRSNQSMTQCAQDSVMRVNHIRAQEQALTAIAAVGETAGKHFIAMYQQMAEILMTIITQAVSEEMLQIRNRAVDCMSRYVEAVGGQQVQSCGHDKILMNNTIAFLSDANCTHDEHADNPLIESFVSVWPRTLVAIGTQQFAAYIPMVSQVLCRVAAIDIVSNRNNELQQRIQNNSDQDTLELDKDFNVSVVETSDEQGQTQIVAIDAQKMSNKLAAFYCFDAFAENYGVDVLRLMKRDSVEQLFDLLLQCISSRYSFDLKTEAAKLSPRYLELLCAAAKENNADQTWLSLLQRKSQQLFDTFVRVMADADNAEAQCTAVMAKALLQSLQILDPTDDDTYHRSRSLLRTFLDERGLRRTVRVLFECVSAAQHRIELFVKQEMNSSFEYDQIAKQEFEEEKEFEDELLFNFALILAELIKIYGDDFLTMLLDENEQILTQLIKFLNPQNASIRNPQFLHKTGIYIICDLYEQCSASDEKLLKLLHRFVPQILHIVSQDDDSAVQQASFYCLGLIVQKMGNVAAPYVSDILTRCRGLLSGAHSIRYRKAEILVRECNDGEHFELRQFLALMDNVMSTVVKCMKHIEWNTVNLSTHDCNQLIALRNQCLQLFISHLPLKYDTIEARFCHTFFYSLVQNGKPIDFSNPSNVPLILKIFATVMDTPLSTEALNQGMKQYAAKHANALTQQQRTKFI